MASYNLNEILKRKAKEVTAEDGTMTLDDVARVKILSPGRQVFKRFIRNRLAVFGTVLLIVMFVFAFLGPVFYPYGQKDIFYKFDSQNVNYALAKELTAYTGYDVDSSVPTERPVNNAMNSNIKKMIASGVRSMLVLGENGAYTIEEFADDVFTLCAAEAEQVCTYGRATVTIGTLDTIRRDISFEIDEMPGLADAAMKAAKGNSGSFEFEGKTIMFEKGAGKSYVLSMEDEGLYYTGEALGAEFENALIESAGIAESFELGGVTYVLTGDETSVDVYRLGEEKIAKVYTRMNLETMEVGAPVSTELLVNALVATKEMGEFTADGKTWSVDYDENGLLMVRDAAGQPYGELSSFSVRRYTGENTMAYELKTAIRDKAAEMAARGLKEGSLLYDLPMQEADGQYAYDENGELMHQETEMRITQRETGEYVINCDQIIYVIDMFAPSSGAHLLGTDGDGFDVLARVMYGGRISLMVGFVVVFLETFLGIIMGGLAGYYGKWVDNLIMRLVDIFYCLPSTAIMIILGAMMDAMRMNTYIRLMVMMATLGVLGWAGIARLVRGQILSLREQEFMVAAEATGIKVKDRIFRHLVPNVMPQLIVSATMGMGSVILLESTLSYLGLGVKHPLATWGTIINSVSSASAMAHYAHIWIPVGLLICLTVIAFNFVGDGLRDAYDPKSKN